MLPSKVPIACKRAHSHGNNSYGPIRKDMRKQRRRRRLRAGASSSLIALGLLYCGWFDESIFFPNKNGRRLEEYVANNAVLGVLSVYLGKVVGSDGNAIRGLSLSPSLEDRGLSLYLGDGKCKWQPPIYDVPDDLIFSKTLIAGFPSGDKRLTFVQMEALTGLSARDEWDFAFLGATNQPFIKANYPHHEGIWGWGDRADQVVMVVRNIRRSMVEYHDILWDIGYAKTFEEASLNLDNLYAERPPLDDFLVWRDLRVIEEIYWYGWFIDYYMEGGLMRDMFTHKITTPEHWYMLMQPTRYTTEQMTYDLIVGNDTNVSPSYDPHCVNDVTAGCVPVEIISAERLVEMDTGPTEGRKIANTLVNQTGIKDWIIEEDAWECIWTELIVNKKGLKTFIDREGVEERDYNFSEEMLTEMIHELNRLIIKYSSTKWSSMKIAQFLVELLNEHLTLIRDELTEVLSGERKLQNDDFLGPETRKAMLTSEKDSTEEDVVSAA